MDKEQNNFNRILSKDGLSALLKDSDWKEIPDEMKAVALGLIKVEGSSEPITRSELKSGSFNEKRQFEEKFYENVETEEIKKFKANLKLKFLAGNRDNKPMDSLKQMVQTKKETGGK